MTQTANEGPWEACAWDQREGKTDLQWLARMGTWHKDPSVY